MSKKIDRVLIYADSRFQVWVERDGFYSVLADGSTSKWIIPDHEDLFALPMNGLVKLALEYMAKLQPKIKDHGGGEACV